VDAAAVGPDQPYDHLKGGRLAGPVPAEEADDFAAADLKADALDDRAKSEFLDEAVGFKNGHGMFRVAASNTKVKNPACQAIIAI